MEKIRIGEMMKLRQNFSPAYNSVKLYKKSAESQSGGEAFSKVYKLSISEQEGDVKIYTIKRKLNHGFVN